MENLYSSTLENLERTFMPHTAEYQRYIDFQTMRDMKQVIKGKRPVYFDLDIKQLGEMDMRYILDGYWHGVFFTAILPKSSTFRGTIEMYGKPPQVLIGRFELGKGQVFYPTYLKDEFTRRKGLGDTLRTFSKLLFTHLDTYVEHMEVSVKALTFETSQQEIFESWDFPYLAHHPDLHKQWTSLMKRTEVQFLRMEELDIEEQYALETMVEKDVPGYIESFQQLSDENKEIRKDELLETMHDLDQFIERLEQKEEETRTQNYARSKGIIASKYNKEDENYLLRK